MSSPSVDFDLSSTFTTETYNDFTHSATTSTSVQAASNILGIVKLCVIVMGIMGTIGNGLVCFLLVHMEWKKKGSTNILVINQLCLDLFSCIFLVIIYIFHIRTAVLTGLWGDIVCKLILNEMFSGSDWSDMSPLLS